MLKGARKVLMVAVAIAGGLSLASRIHLGQAEAKMGAAELRAGIHPEKIEETMAEWLSHPNEFGVRPKHVKYRATVETSVSYSDKKVPVHLVDYEMPDGTVGRGFVNPVTWSFLGKLSYDALSDVELVTAYTGWLWLFPALNNGGVQTQFQPETLSHLMGNLAEGGVKDIQVRNRYKVNDSEFYEFTGVRAGKRVTGAGMSEEFLIYDEGSPLASVPVIYTFLGKVLRDEI